MLVSKVPRDWELVGQRKGFSRYNSPQLVKLVATRQLALEGRETALANSLQVRFCNLL